MAGHSSWFITQVGSSIRHTCPYSGMQCHDGAHLYVPHGLVRLAIIICLQPVLLLYPLAMCSPFRPHPHPTSLFVPAPGRFPFLHLSLIRAAGRGEESNFWPGIALPSLSLEGPWSWFMFGSKSTSAGRDKRWPSGDRTPLSASPSLCLPPTQHCLRYRSIPGNLCRLWRVSS